MQGITFKIAILNTDVLEDYPTICLCLYNQSSVLTNYWQCIHLARSHFKMEYVKNTCNYFYGKELATAPTKAVILTFQSWRVIMLTSESTNFNFPMSGQAKQRKAKKKKKF